MLIICLPTFFKINFFKKLIISGTHSEFQTVWTQPDLDPNCLQRIWADDNSRYKFKMAQKKDNCNILQIQNQKWLNSLGNYSPGLFVKSIYWLCKKWFSMFKILRAWHRNYYAKIMSEQLKYLSLSVQSSLLKLKRKDEVNSLHAGKFFMILT